MDAPVVDAPTPRNHLEASLLDREQGGALTHRIVRDASQPLLAPLAPNVPVDFRRAHPSAPQARRIHTQRRAPTVSGSSLSGRRSRGWPRQSRPAPGAGGFFSEKKPLHCEESGPELTPTSILRRGGPRGCLGFASAPPPKKTQPARPPQDPVSYQPRPQNAVLAVSVRN